MNESRRLIIAGGLAAAATLGRAQAARGAAPHPPLDAIPAPPEAPTPGRPGDFDFLAGEWRIEHWRQRAPNEWDAFEGEATVTSILAGIGSVEELRIPARDFSGLGLRLLDIEKKVWSDFWVNAKSGVLSTPGQTGSFENGVGIFASQDVEDGKPVIYVGVWDKITKSSCRWRQAGTRDGGATWNQTWIMHWTRAT